MIFAIIGTVLLLFSLLGFLTGAGLWLSYLHLGAGLGLLVYAGLTRAGELRELAARDASRRGARLGGNALVQQLALAVILGGLGFLSVRYSVQWDWTDAGGHSLSSSTVDVLAQIPEDGSIEVYGFFTQGSEAPARALLEMYDYESDRLSFQIFDPNRFPEVASRFEISQDGIVLVCEGPCESAEATVRVVEVSEQELTRAIRSAISEQKTIYFLAGHGEAAIDDEEETGLSLLRDAMEAENLLVESLLLANLDAVPDDADAVVIAGPSHSILDRELEALDVYLRGGGSIALLVDPIVVTNLEPRALDWGVELRNDVIVDRTIDLFVGPRIGVQPVVSDFGDHPITEDLKNASTLFQLARSVRAADGSEVVELARTGQGSWSETNLDRFTNERIVEPNEGEDEAGPLAIAVARSFDVEGEGKREGRLVVVGDADFARNRHVSKVYNADFFLNIANWLVGEEQFITIDRKVPRASMAQLTREQFATFRYVAVFFLPEAVLLLGIMSWWRRRS